MSGRGEQSIESLAARLEREMPGLELLSKTKRPGSITLLVQILAPVLLCFGILFGSIRLSNATGQTFVVPLAMALVIGGGAVFFIHNARVGFARVNGRPILSWLRNISRDQFPQLAARIPKPICVALVGEGLYRDIGWWPDYLRVHLVQEKAETILRDDIQSTRLLEYVRGLDARNQEPWHYLIVIFALVFPRLLPLDGAAKLTLGVIVILATIPILMSYFSYGEKREVGRLCDLLASVSPTFREAALSLPAFAFQGERAISEMLDRDQISSEEAAQLNKMLVFDV